MAARSPSVCYWARIETFWRSLIEPGVASQHMGPAGFHMLRHAREAYAQNPNPRRSRPTPARRIKPGGGRRLPRVDTEGDVCLGIASGGMARERHTYREATGLGICTSCGTGPTNPMHLLVHPFQPLGDGSYRDVPEFCRCGLPEGNALHGDPRPAWQRPRELEPADRVPSLLADAWPMPED